MEQPKKIAIPFASNGIKRDIPDTSQIGIVDGAASYTDGFPQKNFLPLAAGGIPPAGADFNGVLNEITKIQQWQSAGGMFKFDAEFAAAVGGYPNGARLLYADGSDLWINTVDGNQTDPDGVSPAGWLSLSDGDGAHGVGYQYPGVGSVLQDVATRLHETVSITAKGASLGAANNRAAIQAAIDDSGITDLYVPPGVWNIDVNGGASGLTGVFGAGSVALKPRSNLRIYGPGTLRLKDGASGASGAMIGNWDGAAIKNFILDGVTLDGNRAATTGQVSGAVLVDATECGFERVRARHMSYNGLQMRRSTGIGGGVLGVKDCWVEGCIVSDVLYIGLQFNRPDGLRVVDNTVRYSGDNAIDIEGNDSDAAGGYVGIGDGITVAHNDLAFCSTGLFIESLGNCLIDGNWIRQFSAAGMYFNRINSGAENNLVVNNRMKDGTGQSGIIVANSSGKMRIAENMFRTMANGIDLRTATHVSVGTNYYADISQQLVKVPPGANQLVKSRIEQQHLEGGRSGTTGKPFTCSPLGNADNSSARDFNVTVLPLWDMENNRASATVDDDYLTGRTGTLDTKAAWSAYAIFFGGETVVYESGANMGVGRYVKINGVLYKVHANTVAGEYTLRSAAGVAGDYTVALNAAHPWVEYWPEWQTT